MNDNLFYNIHKNMGNEEQPWLFIRDLASWNGLLSIILIIFIVFIVDGTNNQLLFYFRYFSFFGFKKWLI